MTPQPPSKQAPWDLTQFSQSPSADPSYFPKSHWWAEISSLLKVTLVLGKARSHRAPNLGCRELSYLGDLIFSPKKSAQDMMHEQAHCRDEAAHRQSPIAAAFWISWIVFMEECSSLMQNLMQIRCSTNSSHFDYNGHTIHMLTQQHLLPPLTSTVKLSLFTHAYSSPLSLAARWHQCHTNCSHYINNGWTFSRQTLYTSSSPHV